MIIHCYVATYFLISNCLKMLNVIISCYVYFLAATIRIIWSENNFSSNSWFAKFFHQITNILVIVGLLLKISSNYTHHGSHQYICNNRIPCLLHKSMNNLRKSIAVKCNLIDFSVNAYLWLWLYSAYYTYSCSQISLSPTYHFTSWHIRWFALLISNLEEEGWKQ